MSEALVWAEEPPSGMSQAQGRKQRASHIGQVPPVSTRGSPVSIIGPPGSTGGCYTSLIYLPEGLLRMPESFLYWSNASCIARQVTNPIYLPLRCPVPVMGSPVSDMES